MSASHAAASLDSRAGLSIGKPGRPGRTALVVAGAVAILAAVVSALPGAYGAIGDGVGRLGHGDGRWIALAIGFEALSFLGHIVLFRTVFVDGSERVGMAASYEITMAGHAATRVFGAAGAGGIAVTVWALRKAGIPGRAIAARMSGFLVLLYSLYAVTVAAVGIGLWTGLFSGGGPVTLTLLPGLLALGVVGGALTSASIARRMLRARGVADGSSRLRARLATASDSVLGGGREAIRVVRRRDPGLAGGAMWWAFDIAVLWACFHAFGPVPPVAIVVLGYFLGLLGNALPFLGSIGGVDGGMIAALLALGADPGTTVVAVIVYRLISCWLPAVPGALAFVQLRRRVQRWEGADGAAEGLPAPSDEPAPRHEPREGAVPRAPRSRLRTAPAPAVLTG
ncbi:MAG TPA: lysylphosphatidylglycerol synthase transmembrane domain-containing protein [Thermoleophilaceae bacterium]|jgi:uncharacterized membrane protein YbhN (UPF0104 family)